MPTDKMIPRPRPVPTYLIAVEWTGSLNGRVATGTAEIVDFQPIIDDKPSVLAPAHHPLVTGRIVSALAEKGIRVASTAIVNVWRWEE